MQPNDACIAFTTCASATDAEQIAKTLVEKKLAACVNILPPIRSIYNWNDEIQDEQEHLLFIKTLKTHYSALEKWCEEHHPYEVPELICLDISQTLPAYLAWINDYLGAQ